VYEEIEELSQEADAKWRAVLTREENATLDGFMDKHDARARELFAEGMAEQRVKPVRSAKRAPPAKRARTQQAAAPQSPRRRSKAA
jgi:hypothetical protein